jgi:hypothetical protein
MQNSERADSELQRIRSGTGRIGCRRKTQTTGESEAKAEGASDSRRASVRRTLISRLILRESRRTGSW